MPVRVIQIDEQPLTVQRFFEQAGDQPTIIERAGKPVCIVYPASELLYTAEGDLASAAGSWHLPPDVMRALCGEEP